MDPTLFPILPLSPQSEYSSESNLTDPTANLMSGNSPSPSPDLPSKPPHRPAFSKQISSYQSFFQLWFLTFLRTLLTSVQQLLQGATPPAPPSPRCEHEIDAPLDFKKPRYLGLETSAFPGKHFVDISQALYEDILARVNGSLPLLILGEDQSGETIWFRVSSGTKVRTQPILDLTLLENGTPKLQHVSAVGAWLFHFGVHSPPLQLNKEIIVPTSIARRLLRVPQWLRTAPLLTYPYTDLWNLELEDDQSFATNRMTSDLAEEIPIPLPRSPSTWPESPKPISQTPAAGTLYESYFIPANPSFLGCVEEPKGSPICAGGYSDVWQCNVRFFTPSEALPAEVAVKVLRSVWLGNRNEADANERKLRRFKQEVITWLGLPKHPNIVPLIGWTLTPDLSFISPWYKQGNLYRHLKNLSDTQRIQILLGIAKGLECLHSRNPPVVHGDLKPENILMSDCGEPLLADFGLSTILGEERMYTSSHRVGGSVPWMSPEQMIEGSRSCQSDVYSFGSLAFTVMTGELPHAGLTDGQITLKVCNSNVPKDPVQDWSIYPRLQEPIKDLLQDCWSRSPDARPSMSAVVRRLTTLTESRGSM